MMCIVETSKGIAIDFIWQILTIPAKLLAESITSKRRHVLVVDHVLSWEEKNVHLEIEV